MSTYTTTTYLLGLYRHLTDRDRHLLALLALLEEHHVPPHRYSPASR